MFKSTHTHTKPFCQHLQQFMINSRQVYVMCPLLNLSLEEKEYVSDVLSLELHSTVVVVKSLSHVWLFVIWTAACQAPLFSMISQSLLRFMSIESVMLSNCLIFCHPLLLFPLFFPSIRVFFNESALWIKWPKYWSFSISPFSEYSGLTSFRIDWFDLFAVQGTLKSLLQHHSLKASILQRLAFLIAQL